MISTIDLDGQQVTLVSLPDCFAPRQIEFKMLDRVATVESIFTGQVQSQRWPGADSLAATLTWPVMTQADADELICFLMALRGKANAFQFGDPMRDVPGGYLDGSVPVVDGAGGNAAGSDTLAIKGLQPGAQNVFVPGDWVQVGYRYYRNLLRASADANGKAVLTLWPTQRSLPADGTPLVLNQPKGLWRLSSNERGWSVDTTYLTSLSTLAVEYR